MENPDTHRYKGDIRFLKDVFFMAISPIVLRARSFILIPFLISFLGTAGYGIWIQFEITLSLLLMIVSLNLGAGMNRLLSGEIDQDEINDDVSSILVIQLVAAIPLALGMIFLANPLATWLFDTPDYSVIIVALAISIVAGVVGNTVRAFLRAQRRTESIAIINTIRWWSELLVIVIVTLLTRSIIALFVGFAIVQIIANLAYPLYAIHKGWLHPSWPRFRKLRAYFTYSLPLFGNTIGFWICNSSDKYFVRWFLGLEALSIYAALYKFGSLILMLLEPLVEVLLPDLAALYDQQRVTEMRRRFRSLVQYFVLGGALVTIGVVASTPTLLLVSRLGVTPSEVVIPLLLLCLGSLFYGTTRLLHDLIAVRYQTGLIGISWLLFGIVNIVANTILISMFGILGTALATLFTFLIGLVALDRIVNRLYTEMHLWNKWLREVLIISIPALIGATYLGAQHSGWYALAGAAVIGLVYLGMLVIFGVIGKRELQFATGLLRR